jgi:peptidoglycan/xylan/chitin deacetylase (PgdA/CDA1 family)
MNADAVRNEKTGSYGASWHSRIFRGSKRAAYLALSRLCWHARLLPVLIHFADRKQILSNSYWGLRLPRVSQRPSPRFQVLAYHRLTSAYDPFFPGVPQEVFREQLAFLSHHYTVMDLGELVRKMRNHDPIPENAVALTFDDGYRDNYELAFPVLQQYGLPATIFLATGFVNGEDVLWNDKITFSLKHSSSRWLVFSQNGRSYRYTLDSMERRLTARDEVLWLLRHIPHLDKLRLVDEITAQLGIRGFGYLWESMLNWDQVRDMHRNGIRFGAHTVTHPILSRIPREDAIREVDQSKRTIESRLNAGVELFAYPVGTRADFDPPLAAMVESLGFSGAVTTIFGTNSFDTDPFALRRGGPAEHDIQVFALKQFWYKLTN